MAEMTPSERAIYVAHFVEAKNAPNVSAKEAVRQQAEAQIRAAVQAEREANCKTMCWLCRGGGPDYETATVFYKGRGTWAHRSLNPGMPPMECKAAAIRARGKED